MRHFWPLLVFVSIFVVALIGFNSLSNQPLSKSTIPQRIISLAPSITETVFALGLGDEIVAVTNYCDFPDETAKLPKVGGFIDPNIEAIIALQPDLVILLANQQHIINQLKQFNIATLTVRNTTLSEIKDAIITIGQYTGHQKQAQQLLKTIQLQISTITHKITNSPRPRVMIAIGHSLGSDQIKTVFVAGQHDFYNELISLAGGQNVYQDTKLKVPSLSLEGILQLNPDIIIDIFPEADDHNADIQQVLQQWHNMKHIEAVKNNRVHIIEQSYATIPGPRLFLLLEQFARIIHPEFDWEELA